MPLTHRGVSASCTVVTGHRRPGEPEVDWRSLARLGGTIVVLMGTTHRAGIAAALVEGGLAASTPVAAVRWATTPEQVITRCRLDALGATPVASPAVLVIGAVAGLDLRWDAPAPAVVGSDVAGSDVAGSDVAGSDVATAAPR